MKDIDTIDLVPYSYHSHTIVVQNREIAEVDSLGAIERVIDDE